MLHNAHAKIIVPGTHKFPPHECAIFEDVIVPPISQGSVLMTQQMRRPTEISRVETHTLAESIHFVAHRVALRENVHWLYLSLPHAQYATRQTMNPKEQGEYLASACRELNRAFARFLRYPVVASQIRGWAKILDLRLMVDSLDVLTWTPEFHVLIAVPAHYAVSPGYLWPGDWGQASANDGGRPMPMAHIERPRNGMKTPPIPHPYPKMLRGLHISTSSRKLMETFDFLMLPVILDEGLRHCPVVKFGGILRQTVQECLRFGQGIKQRPPAQCHCEVCQSDMLATLASWTALAPHKYAG
jgi:hypothetical protein